MSLISTKQNDVKSIIAPSQARFASLFEKGSLEMSPLWMMRQAGRYLPEYHGVKNRANGFLRACKNPKIAAQITLQPLERFELDAAIIFADILLILEPLGFQIDFNDQGPQISSRAPLESLVKSFENNIDYTLEYVGQAIEIVADKIHPNHALIGFCGAPFTVALYALDSKRSDQFSTALTTFYQHPQLVENFIDILTHASMEYLSMQVASGANIVMIFDSWLALAPWAIFNNIALKSTAKLIRTFKARHPHIPVIYYPKDKTSDSLKHLSQLPDIIGVSHNENFGQLQKDHSIIFQGNIDQRLLLTDDSTIEHWVKSQLTDRERPSIINLSHGILKQTPICHVHAFINAVRALEN